MVVPILPQSPSHAQATTATATAVASSKGGDGSDEQDDVARTPRTLRKNFFSYLRVPGDLEGAIRERKEGGRYYFNVASAVRHFLAALPNYHQGATLTQTQASQVKEALFPFGANFDPATEAGQYNLGLLDLPPDTKSLHAAESPKSEGADSVN